MTDFVEVDFLEVGNTRSGDAIAVRHSAKGVHDIYVVDGGYLDDGARVVEHIRRHYEDPVYIDHVVLTHSDGDHANGLRSVLREFVVGKLWMNRPWRHVAALVPRFENVRSRAWLAARLKKIYRGVAELERVARDEEVEIAPAFEGTRIGNLTVLSPSREAYLDRIAAAGRTPVVAEEEQILAEAYRRAEWGEENLKGGENATSAENETSVVQFGEFCGKKVLLTGDAGTEGLLDAYVAGCVMGMDLDSLDLFQAPHHGSRANVSTEVLDLWLGEVVEEGTPPRQRAVVSANQNDRDHPSKAVLRALMHRGCRVYQTRGAYWYKSVGAPARGVGWRSARALRYPKTMET